MKNINWRWLLIVCGVFVAGAVLAVLFGQLAIYLAG